MLLKLLKDDVYYVVDDNRVLATLSTESDADEYMKQLNIIYD